MEKKELVFEELSLEQKAGMVISAYVYPHAKDDAENIVKMIKDHALGAVWVTSLIPNWKDVLRRIREAADYPVLIMTDAEVGFGDLRIPQQISVTAAGAKSEYAYSFGRATAVQLRALGYNVVCNPLLDMATRDAPCGHITRSFGGDKETVTRLAAEVARGTHDAGLLTVAKHYPGTGDVPGVPFYPWDSHMRATHNGASRRQLMKRNLYPYKKLWNAGLIDGVMVGHSVVSKLDPENVASLSKPLHDLLRETGFDGFYITDGLDMMGIVLKYGIGRPNPVCVQAGNDLALPWGITSGEAQAAILEGIRNGDLTEERLNEAVRRVLAAQHKVAVMDATVPVAETPCEEDVLNIRRITEDCISAVCDRGVPSHISKDGKHLFVLMTNGRVDFHEIDYTPGPRQWYNPVKVSERLKQLFPNSETFSFPMFPEQDDMIILFNKQTEYDDVVFITYTQSDCFVGRDSLTTRFVDMMDALQSTDRIVAQVHFGNPFTAAKAPHVPCVLLGFCSMGCVDHALSVLAGDAPAVGTLPYNVKFHKKGDVFY